MGWISYVTLTSIPILANFVSYLSWHTAADDVQVVYQRMYESALSNTYYQHYKELLTLLQPDGSFSDLKYGLDDSESFRTHGRRQTSLLYHHLQGNKNLSQEIDLCFRYITYAAPPNKDHNWWGHLIGTPLNMWRGVVLAADIIEKQVVLDLLDRYWVNTPMGPVWTAEEESGHLAGGNFGPRAMLGEVEGLIRGTYKKVHKEVAEKLHKELAERNPYRGNGVRPDGCLHQHNPGGNHSTEEGNYLSHILWNPYAAAYGKELLRHASLMMTWYSGTDMDYNNETIEGLYSTYLDCQQWICRGGIIEPTLAGRKITNGETITHFGGQGLIQKTGMCLQKMGRHTKAVESVLHRYENVVPDPEYALVGHRHFFYTDLSVHQRREYYASVRMLSNRTVRPESWATGENIKGFFQADGFMTVLVDGGEFGKRRNEVFQVYDWARVPSVTNQYTKHIPGYDFGARYSRRFFNDAKFSGGVTDGHIGVASMIYNRPYVPLRALKSWFFLDDVIVIVGSGINIEPEHVTRKDVITTLTQLVFTGEYVVSTKMGRELTLQKGHRNFHEPSWIFHRNVSYVLMNGDENLHSLAETRFNGQKRLNVFTAWITHSPSPENATLAYAVLPATNLESTREFVNNPSVAVVEQGEHTHIVCHHPSRAVGASLTTAGKAVVDSCGGVGPLEIEVDTPCLLLLTIELPQDADSTTSESFDSNTTEDVSSTATENSKIEAYLRPDATSTLTSKPPIPQNFKANVFQKSEATTSKDFKDTSSQSHEATSHQNSVSMMFQNFEAVTSQNNETTSSLGFESTDPQNVGAMTSQSFKTESQKSEALSSKNFEASTSRPFQEPDVTIPQNSETIEIQNSEALEFQNSETLEFQNSKTLEYQNSETIKFQNSETIEIQNFEVENSEFTWQSYKDTDSQQFEASESHQQNEVTLKLSISDPQQIYDVINISIKLEGRFVQRSITLPRDRIRGSSITTVITM